jgi:hypothetical protein
MHHTLTRSSGMFLLIRFCNTRQHTKDNYTNMITTVFPETLVVKAVHLRDLPALVIAYERNMQIIRDCCLLS